VTNDIHTIYSITPLYASDLFIIMEWSRNRLNSILYNGSDYEGIRRYRPNLNPHVSFYIIFCNPGGPKKTVPQF